MGGLTERLSEEDRKSYADDLYLFGQGIIELQADGSVKHVPFRQFFEVSALGRYVKPEQPNG